MGEWSAAFFKEDRDQASLRPALEKHGHGAIEGSVPRHISGVRAGIPQRADPTVSKARVAASEEDTAAPPTLGIDSDTSVDMPLEGGLGQKEAWPPIAESLLKSLAELACVAIADDGRVAPPRDPALVVLFRLTSHTVEAFKKTFERVHLGRCLAGGGQTKNNGAKRLKKSGKSTWHGRAHTTDDVRHAQKNPSKIGESLLTAATVVIVAGVSGSGTSTGSVQAPQEGP